MLDEDQFQTMLALGFLFRRLGLHDKAVRLYRALLAIRPDEPMALAPAAAAALGSGDHALALELLDRLDSQPRTAAGQSRDLAAQRLLMRAKALWGLGRVEEAKKAASGYLARPKTGGEVP